MRPDEHYFDLYLSYPWECDEPDCDAQWHLCQVFSDSHSSTGFSKSEYEGEVADEEVMDNDLPLLKECDAAWLAYFEYVVEVGEDPLQDLSVQKKLAPKKQLWSARIRDWLGSSERGPVLTHVRRSDRGPWLKACDAPEHVLKYLDCERGYRVYNLNKWQSAAEVLELEGVKPGRHALYDSEYVFHFEIMHREDRPEEVLRRETMRLARKQIRDLKKSLGENSG